MSKGGRRPRKRGEATKTKTVKDKEVIGIDEECPICAKNPDFNAKTRAALEKGQAMLTGKIPFKRHHTIEELREALDL